MVEKKSLFSSRGACGLVLANKKLFLVNPSWTNSYKQFSFFDFHAFYAGFWQPELFACGLYVECFLRLAVDVDFKPGDIWRVECVLQNKGHTDNGDCDYHLERDKNPHQKLLSNNFLPDNSNA